MSKVSSDDIMNFLVTVTEGHKSSTKKLKYSLLKTFFNFIKNSIDQNLQNPCDSTILQKTFKVTKSQPGTILDKDVVATSSHSRDRLQRLTMFVTYPIIIFNGDIQGQETIKIN